MKLSDRKRLEARAEIMKALGHPTRLYLVEQLAGGESSVQELTRRVGVDISTISKHLTVLRQSGLVSSDKRGQQVWYSLKVPCILNFFGCVEEVLKAKVEQARKVIA